MLLALRAVLHIIGSVALYYLAIFPCKAAFRCFSTGNIGWILTGILWLSIPVLVFIWLPVTTFLNDDYDLIIIQFLWVGNYLFTRLGNQST